jgi:hypothetical protein
MNHAWVGSFGQIWLKPDIKHKYLVIFLYFWLVFCPFFSPSQIWQSKTFKGNLIYKSKCGVCLSVRLSLMNERTNE